MLGYVDELVTKAIEWVGDFMAVITANPLILLFVLLPLIGLGIGLIQRLIRL